MSAQGKPITPNQMTNFSVQVGGTHLEDIAALELGYQ
jgi:hypothetical protein